MELDCIATLSREAIQSGDENKQTWGKRGYVWIDLSPFVTSMKSKSFQTAKMVRKWMGCAVAIPKPWTIPHSSFWIHLRCFPLKPARNCGISQCEKIARDAPAAWSPHPNSLTLHHFHSASSGLKVPGQGQGTMNWLGEIYWKRSSLPKKRGFQRIFPTNYGKPGWSINTPKHGVSLRASPGSWASFYHWMCIPVTTWFNQVLEPSYF